MNARNELLDLYEQWRKWTQAEAEAIRAGAWPQVTRCQNAKVSLQERILAATEACQAESAENGSDPRSLDPQIRRIVDELILLELRNNELVENQRGRGRETQRELEGSSRDLRRLQRAYAPSRAALWQQYS